VARAAPSYPGDGATARGSLVAQGGYYALTGAWPIAHLDSFEAVTGPKSDVWLVAIGMALAFAAIDVVYVARGVLRAVYLVDAALQAVFVALALRGERHE
jgi:hypothetical protein